MANYYGTVRTNYFSVKDEAAFHKLMDSVMAEDEIHIFESEQTDGSKKFGFGCYGTISGIASDPDDEDWPDRDRFLEALQELVCENDAIIVTEIGNEKLRYVGGISTVITHTKIQYVDMVAISVEVAGKSLGDPDYQTQMDY